MVGGGKNSQKFPWHLLIDTKENFTHCKFLAEYYIAVLCTSRCDRERFLVDLYMSVLPSFHVSNVKGFFYSLTKLNLNN